MKKNLTELVMILDRSGSMGGLESDTIGGYNAMLEKQKKVEGEVLVSTILFDDVSDVIHDRVPISEVKPITDKEYYVRGCTALLDAVGGAISHVKTIHKYAREEDVPEKTIFVITTDGMENASHQYDLSTVKRMVEQETESHGWEFFFLGANMDAIEVAGSLGITADRAVSYHSDHIGTALNYEVVGDAVIEARTCSMPISAGWKKKIEKDFKKRKKS